MQKRETIYWSAQILGWSTYVLLSAIRGYLLDSLNVDLLMLLIVTFILGITLSHMYRLYIINRKWAFLPLPSLITRVLIATIVIGLH